MHLTIIPHDPLVARDARAFGEGGGARTMNWFNPSVGAGSLRSLLGKLGGGFSANMIAALKEGSLRGPFPMANDDIFLPYPRDLIVRKEDGVIFPLRPAYLNEGEGTDGPSWINLCFPEKPGDEEEDFKPATPPAFWSLATVAQWLASPGVPANFAIPRKTSGEKDDLARGFLNNLPKDHRTHVKITPSRGAAEEGMLFTTSGLTFLSKTKDGVKPLEMAMNARFNDSRISELTSMLDHHHPMGSERRFAHWSSRPDKEGLWKCPDNVIQALNDSTKVRMVLASPAPFAKGWIPGWLEESFGGYVGKPPGIPVNLRLISAIVDRWQPISGWSIERGKPQGPKALRPMAPGGSVYFFEIIEGKSSDLAQGWLESVCDDRQDGKDGFGLALWGIW